jgi:maltooligosyltrehalose trehalohydrolase
VVASQNHDQIGNRAFGERLSALVSFEKLKLAAACVLLSPFTPLLFMGEEFGVKTPFLYFVDHQEPSLLKAVGEGRKAEFESFGWKGETPDPGDPGTFTKSIWKKDIDPDAGRIMNEYYRDLISLSREVRGQMPEVTHDKRKDYIVLHYRDPGLAVILSFASEENYYEPPVGKWECVLQSALYQEARYEGKHCLSGDIFNIAPHSATVLRRAS